MTTPREVLLAGADGGPEVVVRRTYDTDPADLWNALTDPERIPRWFLPVSGDLRLGGRFQLDGNAGGEILACDPPTHLRISWEMGDAVTWVTVTLEPTADGSQTTLELRHSAPGEDEHWAEFGPGAVGVGWDLALHSGLTRHLETSAAVDPAQAASWAASDDGKAFGTDAARAWGDAHAAAGADPATAAEAADRTRAAYTGEASEA